MQSGLGWETLPLWRDSAEDHSSLELPTSHLPQPTGKGIRESGQLLTG